MKAITIHQPWASLIAHGFKRYETRGWRTHYRGPIAIHAGLRTDHQAALMIARDYPRIWRDITPLPSGSIVAVAELVECRKVVSSGRERGLGVAWLEDGYMILGKEVDFGDFTPGRYAWELANVRRIEPVPVKGKQGLWNWDEVCADCELPFLHDRYNAFCNECGDRAYREMMERQAKAQNSKEVTWI